MLTGGILLAENVIYIWLSSVITIIIITASCFMLDTISLILASTTVYSNNPNLQVLCHTEKYQLSFDILWAFPCSLNFFMSTDSNTLMLFPCIFPYSCFRLVFFKVYTLSLIHIQMCIRDRYILYEYKNIIIILPLIFFI